MIGLIEPTEEAEVLRKLRDFKKRRSEMFF